MPDSGQCKCTSSSCSAGFVCVSSGLCVSSAYANQLPGSSSSSGLGGGQIAGIIIGFILGMALVGGLVFVVMRRRNIALLDRLSALFRSESGASSPQDSSVHGMDNPLHLATSPPLESVEEETPGAITLQNLHEDSSES